MQDAIDAIRVITGQFPTFSKRHARHLAGLLHEMPNSIRRYWEESAEGVPPAQCDSATGRPTPTVSRLDAVAERIRNAAGVPTTRVKEHDAPKCAICDEPATWLLNIKNAIGGQDPRVGLCAAHQTRAPDVMLSHGIVGSEGPCGAFPPLSELQELAVPWLFVDTYSSINGNERGGAVFDGPLLLAPPGGRGAAVVWARVYLIAQGRTEGRAIGDALRQAMDQLTATYVDEQSAELYCAMLPAWWPGEPREEWGPSRKSWRSQRVGAAPERLEKRERIAWRDREIRKLDPTQPLIALRAIPILYAGAPRSPTAPPPPGAVHGDGGGEKG